MVEDEKTEETEEIEEKSYYWENGICIEKNDIENFKGIISDKSFLENCVKNADEKGFSRTHFLMDEKKNLQGFITLSPFFIAITREKDQFYPNDKDKNTYNYYGAVLINQIGYKDEEICDHILKYSISDIRDSVNPLLNSRFLLIYIKEDDTGSKIKNLLTNKDNKVKNGINFDFILDISISNKFKSIKGHKRELLFFDLKYNEVP